MITFEHVSKIYKGGVEALRGVSATIGKGVFVFLVGPSGSGKSTMLRLINREETADKGRIFVAGKDIARLSSWREPSLRRDTGWVFQGYKLLASQHGYEHPGFGREGIGSPCHVVTAQAAGAAERVVPGSQG